MRRVSDILKSLRRRPWTVTAAFFLLLGLGLSALILTTRSTPVNGQMPYTMMDQDVLRGILAAAVTLLLCAGIAVTLLRSERVKRSIRLALLSGLVLTVAAGSVVYFYTHRALSVNDYLNFHDVYHYFLGCKYYPETVYTELYGCHLKADAERTPPRFSNRHRVRDLKTYAVVGVEEAREDADCSRFSEARWTEFKRDSSFFSDHLHSGALRDHGYNGTPFSARVAGWIANLPAVSYKNLVRLTLVDLFGLIALFALVAWGFGPLPALLVAAFQFVNFGDYYYHVSFFRYWWLVTLGAGVTLLYRKRYGPAAVFLVASAMLNVFPLLFGAALLFKIAVQSVLRRSLARPHRVFLLWSVAATLCFGGISLLHENPVERYEAFFAKMSRHSGLMTTTRTGFRYNFVYRPTVKQIPRSPGETARKVVNALRSRYRNTGVPRTVLTVLITALFALLLPRLDDWRAALLGGFVLLFMLFSTVVYYYACAALLPLLWAGDLRRPKGLAMTALLFGLIALTILAWRITGERAFANNTVLTAAFTVYIAVTFIVLALETRLFERRWKPMEDSPCPETDRLAPSSDSPR